MLGYDITVRIRRNGREQEFVASGSLGYAQSQALRYIDINQPCEVLVIRTTSTGNEKIDSQ